MAITRIWQSGFESGSLNEMDFWSGTNISVIAAPAGMTGSYALRNVADTPGYAGKSFTATNQACAGFRYLVAHAVTSYMEIFRFRSAGQVDLIDVRHKESTGSLQLYVNNVLQDTSANYVFPRNTVKHIGVDAKFDAASGWVKVYLDGVELLSYTGNTGAVQTAEAIWGSSLDPGSGGRYTYYDDCFIDDTTGEGVAIPVPLLSFYPVTLSGDGNYSQWDGSDGNQVNNYLLVDERPPVTSDYVETAVTAEFDSYALTTISLIAGQTIQAVIPLVYGIQGESTERVAFGTRLSSTDLVGADQSLPTSYGLGGFRWERQTTKPGGGSWGQSDIDSAEVIIKSRGTY